MARLIPKLKTYYRPSTLTEYQALLDKGLERCRFIAGGTSLAFHQPDADCLIDLTGLSFHGCHCESDHWLKIGALTTIRELEKSPLISRYAGGVLIQACRNLASTPLRNLITVGGNILGGFVWSDLPVALLATDAELEIFDGGFHRKPLSPDGKYLASRIIQTHEMVSNVYLPPELIPTHGAYVKFTRTNFDFSIVSVAVSFHFSTDVISKVRIACGGIGSHPQRIPESESILEGHPPSLERFSQASEVAAQVIKPRPDTRMSESYRLDLLKTVVHQALNKALGGI